MKTPEDIKKGLECCMTDDNVGAGECHYGGSCDDCRFENIQALKVDALTYIRMLETELRLRTGKSHRYYFTQTQFEFDFMGKGFPAHEVYDEKRYVSEIDGMAYGWIEVSEPLSPEQIHMYGLISAPVE